MRIDFLGTGSWVGLPGMFCACENCKAARSAGGKNIRTRSQLMIDGILPVDFGPDSYYHIRKHGYDGSLIRDVIVTHVHTDHFYPTEFANRYTNHAHDVLHKTLTVWGSKDIEPAYAFDGGKAAMKAGRVALAVMEPFVTYDVSGYSVTPLPANHGTDNPFLYSIQRDGSSFLLLNDTGMLPDVTVEWLKNSGIRYSAISYDCSFGLRDDQSIRSGESSHMGLAAVVQTRRVLTENGNSDGSTASILTHFSHKGDRVLYEEMCAASEPLGFTVAYDGMTLEI